MADIVLGTLNAKYIHASLGLRYLFANLGELKSRAVLLERDINQPVLEVAQDVLNLRPKLVGLGVYIWNVESSLKLVQLLKALDPTLVVVVGGPEVSHELQGQPIVELADHVICGEADVAFAELCRARLEGRPMAKVIRPPLPDVEAIQLPWSEYSDDDLKHRLLYVEASRGCPYRCEFCLSSLDEKVRQLPLERFFEAMQQLLDRGANHFKFVDRTFNLDVKTSRRILEFFFERLRPGLFLHFEMVPDRLPEALREVIARFPPGVLQFEVGVQTLNPQVEQLISRRQDHARLTDNLRYLTAHTQVHVHADLIVGLPGEDVQSFGRGFDELWALAPHEIQVGMLKRLKGTPIARHEAAYGLIYSPSAPFEILRTSTMSFDDINALRRFAKTWEWFANSGHFVLTLERLLGGAASAFAQMFSFSQWLHAQGVGSSGVALTRRFRFLFQFLTDELKWPRREVAQLLLADYQRLGKSDRPTWLDSLPDAALAEAVLAAAPLTGRQTRHRGRQAADP